MTITITKVCDVRDGAEVFLDDQVQTVKHVRRPFGRDDVAYLTILTLGGAEVVHELHPATRVEVVDR